MTAVIVIDFRHGRKVVCIITQWLLNGIMESCHRGILLLYDDVLCVLCL
jgi:hypothetical protein